MVLPFAPNMMVILSNDDPNGHVFDGRSWNEALNEMSFQNAHKFVVCNPRRCPDMNALSRRTRERVAIEIRHSEIRLPPIH